MKKKVLVILAPGFEEVEALTAVDILRRAGAQITVSGTSNGVIEGRNLINVKVDEHISISVKSDFDLIVLPGGLKGTEILKSNYYVRTTVLKQNNNNKLIAAICAAPTIIDYFGIIKGKSITSHPTVKEKISDVNYSEERVVVDGNIVTSRGPGTAMEFSFKLVEILFGAEKVNEVNKGVLAKIS